MVRLVPCMINDRLACTMPLHLKKAGKTPDTESGVARKVVGEMLAAIEKRGETAVREYAQNLDRWTGEIVVSAAEMERRTRDIPAQIKRDIEFATERVRRFALAQKGSLREFETEVAPGLRAGQRLVPVNVAGWDVAPPRPAPHPAGPISIPAAKGPPGATGRACSAPLQGVG